MSEGGEVPGSEAGAIDKTIEAVTSLMPEPIQPEAGQVDSPDVPDSKTGTGWDDPDWFPRYMINSYGTMSRVYSRIEADRRKLQGDEPVTDEESERAFAGKRKATGAFYSAFTPSDGQVEDAGPDSNKDH